MNEQIKEILKGAVDMHCHAFPEVSLNFISTSQEDKEALEECRRYEMKGIVFKSHMFPTMGKTYSLQQLVPEVQAYSSITINTITGGFNPVAVECAAKLGAKIVHMPTWTAQNDFSGDGFSMADIMSRYLASIKNMNASETLSVFNSEGSLKSEVIRIMEIAKENKMVTFTGHLSKQESFALIKQARDMNYDKIVWCHPLTYGVTDNDLAHAVSMGAYVEFNYAWFLPTLQGDFPQRVAGLVGKIGADKMILTSDHFYCYAPSPAESMRMWAATLLEFGVNAAAIRTMMVDNPWKLLGITE